MRKNLTINKQVYLQAVLEQVPRILGQINSNPGSKTYGCCDRHYWHNNVTAFPNARYQEAVLTLALLYAFFDTPYKGNRHILDLINAVMAFWVKMQEDNGSFNEWYPHEGSYVATAFTSYAISEALLIVGPEAVPARDRVLKALRRSASWLSERSETRVCNQQTGALIALYNTCLLTGDDNYKAAADKYLDHISKLQNEEGWMLEYGGADIGYLSLAIDYLAKYYQKTGCEKTYGIIVRAVEFLANFVHRDGTSGGLYASRNTEYLIPSGFEVFAPTNAKARFIAWNIRENLRRKKSVSIFSLDDRYTMYIAYTWLQAALFGMEEIDRPNVARPDCLFFNKSGFYVNRTDKIEIIANLKKTGALVALLGGRRISDSGIVIEADKKMFSGYINEQVEVIEAGKKGFTVRGPFQEVKENLLTPVKTVFLHLFQMVFGKMPFINGPVKRILRDKMILKQKPTRVMLERKLEINEDHVKIIDRISGLGSFARMIVGLKAAFIYVPSTRWHQSENLIDDGFQVYTLSDIGRDGNDYFIQRTYDLAVREK